MYKDYGMLVYNVLCPVHEPFLYQSELVNQYLRYFEVLLVIPQCRSVATQSHNNHSNTVFRRGVRTRNLHRSVKGLRCL